jgi:hypothetical protein
MRTFKRIFALLSLLFDSFSSYEDVAERLMPRAESEFAKDFLQHPRDRNFEVD